MRDRLSLRIGIAVFALLVAASSPVRADYRSAVSAYENGAYEAALGEFRPLAQSGDPAAQYHLGLMQQGNALTRLWISLTPTFLVSAAGGASAR